MSMIDKIDSSPLFQMLTGIIMEGPGKLMGAIGNALGSIGGAGGEKEGGSLGGGLLSSIGDMFGGKDAPAIAPAKTPELAINTPAPSMDRFEVSMTELGNFSPPNVGAGASRSTGMGM